MIGIRLCLTRALFAIFSHFSHTFTPVFRINLCFKWTTISNILYYYYGDQDKSCIEVAPTKWCHYACTTCSRYFVIYFDHVHTTTCRRKYRVQPQKKWIILKRILLNYSNSSDKVFHNRTAVENHTRNELF